MIEIWIITNTEFYVIHDIKLFMFISMENDKMKQRMVVLSAQTDVLLNIEKKTYFMVIVQSFVHCLSRKIPN